MKSRFSKVMSFVLALVMVLTLSGGFADTLEVSAKSKKKKAPEPVNVYVTIADNTGKLAVRQQSVEVTDIDADGALTINDALYLAHEKYYKGGAEAGYATETGAWGLYLTKLWGDESQWYGFYRNSEYSMGLGDPVVEGDFVDAFCYSDSKKHSDKYTFFNQRVIEVHRNEEFTLKLKYLGYDADFNLVSGKVKNATIIDGSNDTEIKVNKKGAATLSLKAVGGHLITAKSTKKKSVLIPPACMVYVLSNKGNMFTDKATGIKFKVVESGSILKNENGVVTVVENINDAEVPETVVYGKVTFVVSE